MNNEQLRETENVLLNTVHEAIRNFTRDTDLIVTGLDWHYVQSLRHPGESRTDVEYGGVTALYRSATP